MPVSRSSPLPKPPPESLAKEVQAYRFASVTASESAPPALGTEEGAEKKS
jgi:hypothetical protein